MKSVLAILAIAIMTLGMSFVYMDKAINNDVAASVAGKQLTTDLQPAENFVFAANPVDQGTIYSTLEGQLETTNFYQGQ